MHEISYKPEFFGRIGSEDNPYIRGEGVLEIKYLNDEFILNKAIRNAHFPFSNPEELKISLEDYYIKITDYYRNIDERKLKEVRGLFSQNKIPCQILTYCDGDLAIEIPDSQYNRCDDEMWDYNNIANFYGPKGRSLEGEHTLDMIWAIKGMVFVMGKFNGRSSIDPNLSLFFSDFWYFKNDELKVDTRNTYLWQENKPLFQTLRPNFLSKAYDLSFLIQYKNKPLKIKEERDFKTVNGALWTLNSTGFQFWDRGGDGIK